ncbi:hypothetical protein LZ32DRAFT_665905 [Colletotrichum eremochloae]|nr:hypothetical protein LZ32DRAFT_665905 [Colletotrichum eremochloae]
MGQEKLLLMVVAFAAWLLPTRAKIDLSAQESRFPKCATACWQSAIPLVCGTWDNVECVCRNATFHLEVTQCISRSCPRLLTFESFREWDIMCDKPRRNRSDDVWPFLPIHIFTMCCVAARIYSKSWIVRTFSLDDWIITITYIIYMVWFIIGHIIIQKAFGVDIWWSNYATLTWALKLFYIDSCLYITILALTRTSILCFYVRLFPYERFRRLCYALLTIVAVTAVLFLVLVVVQCIPISYNWEGWKGDFGPVKCLNLTILSRTINAITIALDTTILIIPLPLLIKIKSTPRRKLFIISMFSLGIINVIASSVRLHYNVISGDTINITWDYLDLILWTGVEVSSSIAVTSFPSIRLMLHNFFPGLLGRIFAFGGHVEQDHEQYLKTREAQKLHVEGLIAKAITRRARKLRLIDNLPPTIGGGAPSHWNSKGPNWIALHEDNRAPIVPARTEASHILASIMRARSRSPGLPQCSTNNDKVTTTTEISVSSKEKALK